MQKLAATERQDKIVSSDYAEIFNNSDYLMKKLFMPISEFPDWSFPVPS